MDQMTAHRLAKAQSMADCAWESVPADLVLAFRTMISELLPSSTWWTEVSEEAGCKSVPGPETIRMCRMLILAKCDGALSVLNPFV